MRKTKKLLKNIYEALSKTGIVSDTCAQVGISRQTFYRWQEEDINFKESSLEAIDQGSMFISDMAKSNIIRDIQSGSIPSSKYWLNNRDYNFRKTPKHIRLPIVDQDDNRVTGIDVKIITEKQVPDDPDTITENENTMS